MKYAFPASVKDYTPEENARLLIQEMARENALTFLRFKHEEEMRELSHRHEQEIRELSQRY